MAADANAVLQALVTKTTSFTGTGVDLKTGTPRRGNRYRFIVTNYSCSATGAVVTPNISHSSDNTTFTVIASGDPLTLGTAAATAEFVIVAETQKRYIAAALAFSVTTGTPTVSYQVEQVNGKP